MALSRRFLQAVRLAWLVDRLAPEFFDDTGSRDFDGLTLQSFVYYNRAGSCSMVSTPAGVWVYTC